MRFWKSRERSSPDRVRKIPFFFRFSRKSAPLSSSSPWSAPERTSLQQICTSRLRSVRRTSSRLLLTLGLVDGPVLPKPPPESANVNHETAPLLLQPDASRSYINDLDGHSGYGSDAGNGQKPPSPVPSLKGLNGNHKNVSRMRKRNA
jgi:hypothetical protein